MDGSCERSSDPPQFEQKRPLVGLLVPQRVHLRSGGRWGENSNCGAAGRMGASLVRTAAAGAGGANVAGGEKNGGSTEGVAGGAAAAGGAGRGGTDTAGGAVGAGGARPRGGVGATPAPSPESRRFPQS